MIPFVALKAPPEGELMFSAPARRFTQMIFVPAEREFELVLMTEAESAELRDRRIYGSRETLATDSASPVRFSTAPTATSFAQRGPRRQSDEAGS